MGNDWNDFMQSKPVQIVMYAVCVAFSGYYAVDAAIELVKPHETSLVLIENMGKTGFMAMTAVRLLACGWAAIAFARLVIKIIRDEK